MDTKLTLNINKKTVEKAKKYANLNNRSLSDIVENYLNSIVEENTNKKDIKISPFIKSLTSGKLVNHNIDYKKEYVDYISKKYDR